MRMFFCSDYCDSKACSEGGPQNGDNDAEENSRVSMKPTDQTCTGINDYFYAV